MVSRITVTSGLATNRPEPKLKKLGRVPHGPWRQGTDSLLFGVGVVVVLNHSVDARIQAGVNGSAPGRQLNRVASNLAEICPRPVTNGLSAHFYM